MEDYSPITQVVPPLPSKYGDSTDESEPGIDYLKLLRPEYLTPDDHFEKEYYSVKKTHIIDSNNLGEQHQQQQQRLPFSGQGRPLREAIKDAWETWKEMLYSDANSGITEAQIDLSMAYWRGDVNYQIEQDKEQALEWMEIAATKGKHEINPKGGCGFENCFRCYAENLYRRMKIWILDEKNQKEMSIAQIVALNTPHLIFNILNFCDIDTLSNLFQVNNLWHEIISDSRAWSHINMLERFPIPSIPTEFLPDDSPLLLDGTLKKNEKKNDDLLLLQNLENLGNSELVVELEAPEYHCINNNSKRDSKTDITLFRQLPPLHRNICRVCNEKIVPPSPPKDKPIEYTHSFQIQPNPIIETSNNDTTPQHPNSDINPNPNLPQTQTNHYYQFPEPYMIEATTIPDPFWKFFACHRSCFYKRAQGTITPYTLQGVKTVVFQNELKKEANHQITWERYAFRRIQIPNMNKYTANTLVPPLKPLELDENRLWCENFIKKNPDLIKFLEETGQFNGDDDEDLDDIDGGDYDSGDEGDFQSDEDDEDDEDDDDDDDDESYGQRMEDVDDKDGNKDGDEDKDHKNDKGSKNNGKSDNLNDDNGNGDMNDGDDDNDDSDGGLGSGFDMLAFLNGEKFQLLDDKDHRDNNYWQRQVNENRTEIQKFWKKNDMVKWYDKSIIQYEYIANVILAYSSGLMWNEYPTQQFYDLNVQNCIQKIKINESQNCVQKITANESQNPTPNQILNTLQHIKPVDLSLRLPLSYDYMTFPRAYPPQTKKKIDNSPYGGGGGGGDNNTGFKGLTEGDSNEENATIDPSDLPNISPGLLLPPSPTTTTTTTTTSPLPLDPQNNKPNQILTTPPIHGPNPYDSHDLIPNLIQSQYPNQNFIIDNSPLWLLLTNFTQYRKYAKLFHEYDDVTVEYPIPQSYLFPHGDSRYCNDINYTKYLFGQPGQFPQQMIKIEQDPPDLTHPTTLSHSNCHNNLISPLSTTPPSPTHIDSK